MNGRGQGEAVEDLVLLQRLLGDPNPGRRQSLWHQFVRRYERLIEICVRKVLRRYGVTATHQEVDDATSDVWLALLQDDLRKLRQYDAARGFRLASFIGMVATNTTIDHLRGRHLRSTTTLEAAFDGKGKDPSFVPRDTVEDKERAELARRALVQLTVDERDFFVECFQAERSPDELARDLGISTNTVYARKFKLREKLADIVASLTAIPPARALARS
jgi:RNA polymerase sigma factor (sigma-70 family)